MVCLDLAQHVIVFAVQLEDPSHPEILNLIVSENLLSRSSDLVHLQVLHLLCSGKRMRANVKPRKLILHGIKMRLDTES